MTRSPCLRDGSSSAATAHAIVSGLYSSRRSAVQGSVTTPSTARTALNGSCPTPTAAAALLLSLVLGAASRGEGARIRKSFRR
jgi:hypothetical protein